MPIAPSFADLIAQGEAELKNVRPDLAVLDGDVTEADLHAAGAMADACIRFSALAFKETFLDGAEGTALTTLVNDHLNIQRHPPTFATLTARFARTSGGAGGTIPLGTTIATLYDAAGKQVRYVTDANIVVGAGNNGPFDIGATAVVSGRDGRAEAGTVTKIVDNLFDTFTVTNPARAAGGNAEETDDELRYRARTFFSTLRRGTLAALEFGALQVASVRVARVVESPITGVVQVLIGDADGNSTAQMIEDVEFELENWRAAGVAVTVFGGTQLSVEITATVVARDGFDVAAVLVALETAVVNRGNRQRPGQTFYLDTVIATVIGLFPDDIFDVTFTTVVVGGVTQPSPIDVVPVDGQVIRVTSFTVT